jgi:hypothetical protein
MNSDLFGGGDAVVKYVLEGHDRGVNWAVSVCPASFINDFYQSHPVAHHGACGSQ